MTRTPAKSLVGGALIALIAAASFALVAAPSGEAQAKPRFKQLAKIFIATRGKPTIDIRASIQTGRRDCSKSLNQNADINIAFVVQRCRNNRAVINQDGRFDKGKIRQR